MKIRSPAFLTFGVALCLLLLPSGQSLGQSTPSGQGFQNTSWALGIVIPEGASLQDGTRLRWEGVANVTAEFTLPRITMPDKTVYAVVSIMTSDGSVLQAAAGMRPNDSLWLGYAWSVPSAETIPIVYHWILSASSPSMAPGTTVSISLFHSAGGWALRILEEATGTFVERQFPSGPGPYLRVGDQEVFSLESYSRSGQTFQNMGNLTLVSILIDGAEVTGGVYPYGGWDPNHNPLFVVGSSGTSPPSFISLGQTREGSYAWGYARPWGGGGEAFISTADGVALLSLAFASALAVLLWKKGLRGALRRENRLTG